MANKAVYAQGLLDLVKAYTRIPHHVLLREVIRLGYPIWLLQLAVATYRLLRVIRVEDAISCVIQAIQGIVVGSGTATTEMRLIMTNVIDAAFKVFPTVTPTAFVDDVGAETADADEGTVISNLTGFLRSVCSRLTADGLEISPTKSVVTASVAKWGEKLPASWLASGLNLEQSEVPWDRPRSRSEAAHQGIQRQAQPLHQENQEISSLKSGRSGYRQGAPHRRHGILHVWRIRLRGTSGHTAKSETGSGIGRSPAKRHRRS